MTALTNLVDYPLLFLYVLVGLLLVVGAELVSRIKQLEIKRIFIICLSVAMLGWLDLWSLIILSLLSTVILYIVRTRIALKKVIYPLSLVLIVFLLVIKDFSTVTGLSSTYIPLGVSYYFFRLISFLIEYSKDPEKLSKISPLDFYSWIFFFPVLLAGPILRYHEFNTIEQTTVKKVRFYRILTFSLCIKIIVVDLILFNLAYGTLFELMEIKLHPATMSSSGIPNFIFLFGFSFTAFLHAYLDLMIYTEMSKSMAGILGFSNVDNFNRPMLATNISQFWQRWHISLSGWTRDYIFFPMLIKTRMTWLSTYASMLILGIWHAVALNWIVWALSHATAINLYGEWRKTRLFSLIARTPYGSKFLKISGNMVTISFVGFIFIFVAISDFSKALFLISRCF